MRRAVLALTWTMLAALASADFHHFVVKNEDDARHFENLEFEDEDGVDDNELDYSSLEEGEEGEVSQAQFEAENAKMLQYLVENGIIDGDYLLQLLMNLPNIRLIEEFLTESDTSYKADYIREIFWINEPYDSSYGVCRL